MCVCVCVCVRACVRVCVCEVNSQAKEIFFLKNGKSFGKI